MVCPHGQGGRGLSQCGHFADKGGEVNFLRFCADVLYGRSLMQSKGRKIPFQAIWIQKAAGFNKRDVNGFYLDVTSALVSEHFQLSDLY